MTEREKIIALFNAAGESAGWKPGIGNDLVLNYLSHFAELVKADFLKSSGQYLTNDASREACIKQARDAALEEAASHLNILAMQAKRSMELGTEADDPSTWVTFDEAADAIREMAKEMK